MSKIETPHSVGKYEIRGLVGKGAMGVVYSAIDPDLGRPVAIKTMSIGDSPHEAEMRLRFLREGRSAGLLQHPNIITVHELFEEGGTAYLVMELLEGASLSSLIRRKKNFSLGERLSILEQIASGLAEAHANGIVHRDLKPSNVFVLRNGVTKVLDFGVAKVGEGGLTKAGTVFGTVEYMAPEQVRGQTVSPRADVFSLGVVAYELLTGRNPFRADTLAASVFKIVSDTPERLAGVPSDVDALVFKALEKNESARFASMTELRDAIETAASSGNIPLKRPGLIEADVVVTKDRGDVSVGPEPRVSQWSHVAAQADLLEELYHQGVAAFQSGDYAACVEKMSQVLDDVPVHSMALHYLAMSEENLRKSRLDEDAHRKASAHLTAMREAHRAGEPKLVMERANALLAVDKESLEARWYRRHAEARLRGATVGGPPRSFGYAPSIKRPSARPASVHLPQSIHVPSRGSSAGKGLWVLGGVGVLFVGLVTMWLSALGAPPPAASADRGPMPSVRTSPFDNVDDDGTVVLQLSPTRKSFTVEHVIPTVLVASRPMKIGVFGRGLSEQIQVALEGGGADLVATAVVSGEQIELEILAEPGHSSVVVVLTDPSGAQERVTLGVSEVDTN